MADAIKPIPKRVRDLTGQSFGMWEAVSYAGYRLNPRNNRIHQWNCICECGTRRKVDAGNLASGGSKSCGCTKPVIAAANGRANRGMRFQHPREYRSYSKAKGRCRNPANKAFANYGGRGIAFLFVSFEDFFHELGHCPDGHSIDRIDNDGNYEPGNVRWTTSTQQARNRRSNINAGGKTLAEFCEYNGLHYPTVHRRHRELGWCLECSASDTMKTCKHNVRSTKGCGNHNSKFTPDQIRAIRNDTRKSEDIARHFGVSGSIIRRIRRMETYKDVV